MFFNLLSISDSIGDFFLNIFGNNYLVGVIISMIPLVELKGGILYMIARGVNPWLAYLCGFIGTSVLAPILLLVFIPLIKWMKKTKILSDFANWLEKHFSKKSKQLEEKASKKADDARSEEAKKKAILRAKYIGLFVFTAIPLPLTGCWTASIVAAMMGLDYKKSVLFIVLGNLVAGGAITLLGGVLKIAFFAS